MSYSRHADCRGSVCPSYTNQAVHIPAVSPKLLLGLDVLQLRAGDAEDHWRLMESWLLAVGNASEVILARRTGDVAVLDDGTTDSFQRLLCSTQDALQASLATPAVQYPLLTARAFWVVYR